MNREERFKRTKAILNPDETKRETWAVLGVGSGGSRVAEEAARFGVGTLILVDHPKEKLEEHNVIRHVLGYRDLGRLKVEALQDHLLNINPDCRVEATGLDITEEGDDLQQILSRATQVHLCTDNERSKHVVNEAAVRTSVTLIFAGVFDGGCGGEVGRVLPGGACYACIADYLNRSGRFDQDEVETFDYSSPDAGHKSTAALNLDIAQIALIQARVGLLTMQAGQNREADFHGNYILFGNRPVEGLFPRMLSSDVWTIPQDPNCLICSSLGLADDEANSLAERILQEATHCTT